MSEAVTIEQKCPVEECGGEMKFEMDTTRLIYKTRFDASSCQEAGDNYIPGQPEGKVKFEGYCPECNTEINLDYILQSYSEDVQK